MKFPFENLNNKLVKPFSKKTNRVRIALTAITLATLYGLAAFIYSNGMYLKFAITHKGLVEDLVVLETVKEQKVDKYSKTQDNLIRENLSNYLNVEASGK